MYNILRCYIEDGDGVFVSSRRCCVLRWSDYNEIIFLHNIDTKYYNINSKYAAEHF